MLALRNLFSIHGEVSRRFYFTAGAALMLLKFSVDNFALWLMTGEFMMPWNYLLPFVEAKELLFKNTSVPFFIGYLFWSLPFAFIGGNLSMRRAHDAGLSRRWGLLFFVPFLNLLTIILLSVVPSKNPRDDVTESLKETKEKLALKDIIQALVAWHLVVAVMMSASVYGINAYGSALFMGTPFLAGFAASVTLNRHQRYSRRQMIQVVAIANGISMGLFLSLAVEGIICILMAGPIVLAASVLGALLGRNIDSNRQQALSMMALALPLLAFAEAPQLTQRLRPVVTKKIINASPEKVWPNVIGFSEITGELPWYFETGIAMPLRARIEGEGVGAVRHCEFTTGSFVEPITVWEPPTRLAFDVASQPPTMEEWSPFGHISPPHIEDSVLRSQRGEFLLKRISSDKTLLIGTTWYDFDMAPYWYWTLWSDAIIHKIHERVLSHIALLSEES